MISRERGNTVERCHFTAKSITLEQSRPSLQHGYRLTTSLRPTEPLASQRRKEEIPKPNAPFSAPNRLQCQPPERDPRQAEGTQQRVNASNLIPSPSSSSSLFHLPIPSHSSTDILMRPSSPCAPSPFAQPHASHLPIPRAEPSFISPFFFFRRQSAIVHPCIQSTPLVVSFGLGRTSPSHPASPAGRR